MSKLNKQQQNNKPHRKRKVINIKRIVIIAIFVAYAIMSIFQSVKLSESIDGDITLNQFYEMIDNDNVEKINLNKGDNIITVYAKDGSVYDTLDPDSDTFLQEIMEKGVVVSIQKKSTTDALMNILGTLPMMLILAMFAVYLSTTILGASTKMFTLIKNQNNHTTFDDIKGMGKTKEQVQFIISQMKNWKELGKLGARPCKGLLLFGPPGVGKTMLAKAIAKESGVGFISCSGSDFDEVFVGVGAGRIRSLFELAATNAPCIIFIDEVDCLGRRRRGGDGASQDHNQTLNALLQKMDGLNTENGIIVIGATNRKEDLDEAIMRPGRFDRHLYIGAPDNKNDRDELVDVYLKSKKAEDDVTLERVSKLMIGLSGAQVEESLNSAVYLSLQDGRNGIIKYSDIDEAIMQLHTDGIKREHSSKRDEQIVSVHEAGHCLVSLLLDLPIAKVSNIPYSSGMGGVTIPDLDETGEQKLKFKSEYIKDIKVLLAGKCAEQIVFGEHTPGCQNDIDKATNTIINMQTSFVFDDKSIVNEGELLRIGLTKEISKDTIAKCNELLEKYNNDVIKLLNDNRDKLDSLTELLMKNKTIVEPTLETI